MGGQRMVEEFEPHEKPAPEPSITIEQFRERFTEEHRIAMSALLSATLVETKQVHLRRGLDENAAQVAAMDGARLAREGLILIGLIHPIPYKW